MNLYVIGPVTGIEDGNRPEFEMAQKELTRNCYIAYTPFEVVPEDDDYSCMWEFCMEHSLRHILANYDYFNEPPHFGIAMLDGWEESNGAKIEHDLAVSLGIPCKPLMEWLDGDAS